MRSIIVPVLSPTFVHSATGHCAISFGGCGCSGKGSWGKRLCGYFLWGEGVWAMKVGLNLNLMYRREIAGSGGSGGGEGGKRWVRRIADGKGTRTVSAPGICR